MEWNYPESKNAENCLWSEFQIRTIWLAEARIGYRIFKYKKINSDHDS